MRVGLKQNIGTLFGLRFGLVLESIDETIKNMLLIVPHGQFNVHRRHHHVEVEMAANNTELRTPSFFIYHVTHELQSLKANSFVAWFYLAHLHAATSYPLPDPFTGMTGAERALQILQLGVAWSSEPYDKESLNTLSSLAALSPIRRLSAKQNDALGHGLQLTEWPPFMHSHAAQDAFVLIVKQLIADSMRLAHLISPKEKMPPPLKTTCGTLNARSHARYVPYAPNCSISSSLLKCDNRVTHFIAEQSYPNMKNVRKLAAHFNGSEREFHLPTAGVGEFIFELFSTEKLLTGNTKEYGSPIMNFVFSTSLANLWIRLYECIRLRKLTDEHFHLMLTLMAFEGFDIRHLQILQAIAAKPMEFQRCDANRTKM